MKQTLESLDKQAMNGENGEDSEQDQKLQEVKLSDTVDGL